MKFFATNAALFYSLQPNVNALDLCRTCEKIAKCAKKLDVCENAVGTVQKLIQVFRGKTNYLSFSPVVSTLFIAVSAFRGRA